MVTESPLRQRENHGQPAADESQTVLLSRILEMQWAVMHEARLLSYIRELQVPTLQLGNCTSNTAQTLKQRALDQNTTHRAGWGSGEHLAKNTRIDIVNMRNSESLQCTLLPDLPWWKSYGKEVEDCVLEKPRKEEEAAGSIVTSPSLCHPKTLMRLMVLQTASDIWTVKGNQASKKCEKQRCDCLAGFVITIGMCPVPLGFFYNMKCERTFLTLCK